jgi:hypothetical protein
MFQRLWPVSLCWAFLCHKALAKESSTQTCLVDVEGTLSDLIGVFPQQQEWALHFFRKKWKKKILSVPSRQVRRFEQGVPGMASSAGLTLLTLILQPIFITEDLVRGFFKVKVCHCKDIFLNHDNKVLFWCLVATFS